MISCSLLQSAQMLHPIFPRGLLHWPPVQRHFCKHLETFRLMKKAERLAHQPVPICPDLYLVTKRSLRALDETRYASKDISCIAGLQAGSRAIGLDERASPSLLTPQRDHLCKISGAMGVSASLKIYDLLTA